MRGTQRPGIAVRNTRLCVLYTVSQYTPLYWAYMYHLVVEVRGLGATEFGALKAIYYFSVVLLEVPFGVLADRVGRKGALLVGACFNGAGCLLYVVARDLATFAAGEICFGVATALVSGASSALLHDSLPAETRPHAYPRAEGLCRGAALLAGSVGFVLTDVFLVRDGDPVLAYTTTAAISCLGIAAAGAMTEPPRERRAAHVIARGALRDVVHSRTLLATILYSGTIFVLMRAMNALFFNPVLAAAGLPANRYGAVMTVVGLLGALAAWQAQRLMRAGIARTLVGLPLLLVGIYVGLALTGGSPTVALLVAHGLAIGLHPVLVSSLLNARISASERRATVLSIESLVSRGLYGAAAVALGWALDVATLAAVLAVTAGLGLAPLALASRLSRGGLRAGTL